MSSTTRDEVVTIRETARLQIWQCNECGAEAIAPNQYAGLIRKPDCSHVAVAMGWYVIVPSDEYGPREPSIHLCDACGRKYGLIGIKIRADLDAADVLERKGT